MVSPPTRPGGAGAKAASWHGEFREGDVVAVYEHGQHMATGSIMTLMGSAAVIVTAGGRLVWAEHHKMVLVGRRDAPGPRPG